MSYRVQESFVSQKRSPWINLVLVLALLAFVGFSMIPLLGTFLKENQPSAGAAAAPTISTEKQADLEAQAQGYKAVLQREPQNATALRGLLEVQLKLGDIKGAITPLEQIAKQNPEQTDYAVLLAQAKQQVGDREGAAQTYRTILSSKPGNLNALQGLVSLLLQQDQPERAIGLLQDTLKTATPINDIKPELWISSRCSFCWVRFTPTRSAFLKHSSSMMRRSRLTNKIFDLCWLRQWF